MTSRLRFAVLADAGSWPAWQVESVQALLASGCAELVAVIVPESPAPARRRKLLKHLLYYAIRTVLMRPQAWKSRRAEALFDGARIVTTRPVNDGGMWNRLDDACIAQLRALNLDFALRFGFDLLRGAVLDVPKYGVWSFHHGDPTRYRGRPAFFWETLHGESTCAVILQRLTETLDGGVILRQGWFKIDPASYSRSLQAAYQGSAHFPAHVCRTIAAGRAPSAAPLERHRLGPIYRLPSNLQALRMLLRLALANLRLAWRAAFIEKRWTIGWAADRGELAPAIDEDWRWLPARDANRFIADPFLVPRSSPPQVLCELLDYRRRRGVIARIQLADLADRQEPQILLADRDLHYSYPCTFEHDGGLYCVPESAQSGHTWLHQLDPQTFRVLARRRIIESYAAIDPTVFRHDGRWWLLCTHEGPTSLTHLDVFCADDVHGPWRAHAGNPVVVDPRGARPAGAPFMHQGALYRCGQDCSERYGGATNIYRIGLLSEERYEEELAARVAPARGTPASDGTHTLSRRDGLVVIDGYRETFSLLAWYRRLQLRLPGRDSVTASAAPS
jgi:hypothetical protein